VPSFFDKVKSGAEKAAFEADRLRRVNQAQGVLKGLQRDLDALVAGWGPQVLALFDAGSLTQPELLEAGPKIVELRQKIADQETEIARIKEEKPPEPEVVAPPAALPPVEQAEAAAPAASPAAPVRGRFCANCGAALPAGVKFCMECGTKVEV
jgi:hypothetical protein